MRANCRHTYIHPHTFTHIRNSWIDVLYTNIYNIYCMQLLFIMYLLMFLQITLLLERLPTPNTGVWSSTIMCVLMYIQMSLLPERLTTQVTGVYSLSTMNALVSFQFRLCPEQFKTYFIGELSLPSMYHLMFPQRILLSEWFTTQITGIWMVSIMYVFMQLLITAIPKRFIANITLYGRTPLCASLWALRFHSCLKDLLHTRSVNKVMRLIQYNSVLTFKLQIEFVPFKIVPLGGYTHPETLFPLFVATLVVANRNRF